MNFSFEVRAVLELEHNKGDKTSKHVGLSYNLDPSKNLDVNKYLDKEGLPTKDGAHVITGVLTQALIANIHMCHQEKFRDSAEHLRYIIAELERGFPTVAHPHKSTF